jgi:hypothetical protein
MSRPQVAPSVRGRISSSATRKTPVLSRAFVYRSELAHRVTSRRPSAVAAGHFTLSGVRSRGGVVLPRIEARKRNIEAICDSAVPSACSRIRARQSGLSVQIAIAASSL